MNTGILGDLARLADTVHSALISLELDDLSPNERAVLFALTAVCSRQVDALPVCHTEDARAHKLTRQMSQPTFHRNLRRLIARGLVIKVDGLSPGEYALRLPATPADWSP